MENQNQTPTLTINPNWLMSVKMLLTASVLVFLGMIGLSAVIITFFSTKLMDIEARLIRVEESRFTNQDAQLLTDEIRLKSAEIQAEQRVLRQLIWPPAPKQENAPR